MLKRIALPYYQRAEAKRTITSQLCLIPLKKICPGVQDAEEQKALGCVECINTSLCEKNDGHLQVQILCTRVSPCLYKMSDHQSKSKITGNQKKQERPTIGKRANQWIRMRMSESDYD